MRYLATVSYDGGRYEGWQIQVDALTIEEEIEKSISKILNTPTKIYGSGRTDKGVHAHGQTFHFDSDKINDIDKFRYSLNCVLPKDIFVSDVKLVSDDFHARYNVKSKTYIYLINMGEYDLFNRNYIYQLLRPLDVELMKKCSELFIGNHNFMNFTSKKEDESNYVRTINSIEITNKNNIISLTFNGNGFMRYMVRMIVGTLIEVGLHRLSIEEVKDILNQKERNVVSFKAPSEGLYLEKVEY